MKTKAFFITVEGLEGSGKSSIIAFLKKYLEGQGYSIKIFREPGSTKIGEKIRRMLLNKKNKELAVHTELLLYLAARTQLIEEKLREALRDCDFIICDRFFDSTLVYQGVALGLKKVAESSVKLFYLGIVPDLTILLDTPIEEGLARIKNKDRIESRPINFHKKLRKGYLQLARRFPQRIKVVDGRGNLDTIYQRVEKVVKKFLAKHDK